MVKKMAKLFDRNMMVMLIAIMIGIVIITYFIADINRRSQIDTLTIEHKTEITDITSRNQNFTDNFLQGSLIMDRAREQREISNYYFDFALFWYNTGLQQENNTNLLYCAENCTVAMDKYLISYDSFNESKPLFQRALSFTDDHRYMEILDYYQKFADSGMTITLLRYNASKYLKSMAENITLGHNVTDLFELFNETMMLYGMEIGGYLDFKNQIDLFLFFDPIREKRD
ncbi:MAG: hypothetical protein R6V50_02720 [Thermoplasmatota archaeon]